MIQKKNVLNTVPVICLGALLLGAAYGQLHTPMTPPPITALASDILPTTGNVRALVVVVDFADAKYDTDRRLSDEEISSYLFGTDNTEFYPCESLTSYFDRASYDRKCISLHSERYDRILRKNERWIRNAGA